MIKSLLSLRNLIPTLITSLLSTSITAHAEEQLHIYNWSDYIAEDTIEQFEAETGIDVVYDVYDANEVLEAKLLVGNSGYDVVFPTARPFAQRMIKAGIFQKLDKSQLSNFSNLSPVILKSLADIDGGNQYLMPYMWGSSGIGINVDKVKAILGDDMPLDSWDLLFNPKITAKLKDCGIALMDDPIEVFVAARIYLGKDTADFSKKAIAEASKAIEAVRGDIAYFHSSKTIGDMANGDICVAHGYSGDMLQAKDRADEAGNGVHIEYLVPKEGAVVWNDVAAILKDAPHPQAAHKFINFLMRPDVMANITNYVAYANANAAATPLVDEEIRNNPGIYPSQATQDKFVVIKEANNREIRNMNRAWTRVKSGR